MTVYKLFIEKAVYKQLKNIPERDYQKIITSIGALANNPRPPGCKKLKGRPGITGKRERVSPEYVVLHVEKTCSLSKFGRAVDLWVCLMCMV
jgi:mRNA interferase RelE/StbE